MGIFDSIQLISSIVIMIGVISAIFFAQRWFRLRKREADTIAIASGTSGYIIIDLPEKQKSLFHDLLKGFEDFAKIKGYSGVPPLL